MPLRPYQQDLKDNIRKAFIDGHKHIILSSPTGSGKTVTFADIAKDAIKAGSRVMIAVDRSELLKQSVKKLIEYGLNPSIITAGKRVSLGKNCYVATVQTLIKRQFPDIDLLIIDEAHKQIFDKLMDEWAYKDRYVLGVTATPSRSGKMNQLSLNYDKMIEGVSIKELISLNFLTPAISYGAKVDTSKLKISRGDYDNSQMFNMFDKQSRYSGVVNKYIKFANKTKAICFNVNVEHSKKVTEAFRAQGISSEHIDGNTPKKLRESILESFSKGYIQVLNNVDVLTTGYDEWSIETVIVNRATKSLPLWLQMCGRGSRIVPDGINYIKDYFNIIDMGGNIFEHGFWEADREYSLSHKVSDVLGVAPVKSCKENEYDHPTDQIKMDRLMAGLPSPIMGCGAIIAAPSPICKYCGFVFEKKKKKEAEEVEFIQLENYESLPEELIGRSWGSMTIEELETVRVINGYKIGWIVKQILISKDLNLVDYGKLRKYKFPTAWANRMKKLHTR